MAWCHVYLTKSSAIPLSFWGLWLGGLGQTQWILSCEWCYIGLSGPQGTGCDILVNESRALHAAAVLSTQERAQIECMRPSYLRQLDHQPLLRVPLVGGGLAGTSVRVVTWFRRGTHPWGDPRGALASQQVGQVRDQRLTAYPLRKHVSSSILM